MSEKERTVETTLTPEVYRKFLAVKERFGQVANSNVLRILITEEYDRIAKIEEAHKEYERWVAMRAQ